MCIEPCTDQMINANTYYALRQVYILYSILYIYIRVTMFIYSYILVITCAVVKGLAGCF